MEETQQQREARYQLANVQEEELMNIGKIESFTKDHIVVESLKGIILNLDNIILTEDRHILGTIDDVVGKIETPYYIILIDKYTDNLLQSQQVKQNDSLFAIKSQ